MNIRITIPEDDKHEEIFLKPNHKCELKRHPDPTGQWKGWKVYEQEINLNSGQDSCKNAVESFTNVSDNINTFLVSQLEMLLYCRTCSYILFSDMLC